MPRIAPILWCCIALPLLACSSSESPAQTSSGPPETPPTSATEEPGGGAEALPGGPAGVSRPVAAQSRARRSARYLGRTLKERLGEVLGESGPVEAVRVCSTEAGEIVADMESHGGLRVGRASLRLRNASNAPPEWVMAWLREQGEGPAEGVEGISEIDGKARFLAPIAVEPVCLTCHGAPENIPPAVRAALRERYPDDQAVGYSEGDLRGALWAEAEI